MGYSSQSKGYSLYNLKTNKLIISKDVIFDEKTAWNWEEVKLRRKQFFLMNFKQTCQLHHLKTP